MKRVYQQLLVAAFSVFVTACSLRPSHEDFSPRCSGVACDKVAERENLSNFSPAKILSGTVSIGPYHFNVPAEGRAYQKRRGRIQIVFPDKSGILFNIMYADDFDLEHFAHVFDESQYTVADYPLIMFMKRDSDPEPENIYDGYIWRLALNNKGYMLREQLYYHQVDQNLTIYFGRAAIGPISQVAFIADKRYPGQLLKILGYQLEMATFKSILASMVTK
ncbi:hypothetical protein KCM76_14775 [Zooshikella marina]|uniref:hypothetical protein n=1 Tax=Zooshikella ganghwensis TaxID=202772 RepID=UPI001BB039C9|nr:hypothetical protein [Zooshikella ganghwensis]MBU2707257.1 hypothetical protein [Zooshikella ganghwensis]